MFATEKLLQNTNYADVYQLPAETVDVPAMVERAQGRLIRSRRMALAEILASSIWGEDYPSVKSFHIRTQYRNYSKENQLPQERVYPLEPRTGAINVPSYQVDFSELGRFFTPLRVRQEGNFTQLRGLTFYTALDFSKNTPAKKLAVMGKDVREGLSIVSSVDRKSLNAGDFLLYLGILDHLKFHSLTAFHALTYHERRGEIPDDQDYLSIRGIAQKVMSELTRAYYQSCLGQSFDSHFNPTEIERDSSAVADYIANSGHTIVHFTMPEVINPLIILLGAHETARRKPYPDTIIGIPSGGTEVALATSFMYENLYPEFGLPETVFIPLSFHYQAQGGIDSDRLVEMIAQSCNPVGKSVLIVDDNSNTGSTLDTMAKAVKRAGAVQRYVHIAEIDPARVLAKENKGNLSFGVVNMDHPDLETAMGLSGASDSDGSDSMRKSVAKFTKRIHEQVEKRQVTV